MAANIEKSTAAQKHDEQRSPDWPEFRDKFIAANPRCIACGKGAGDGVGLQAHHIFPFHYCILLGRPDLELDDRNLITLCETEAGHAASENHHLLIGHLDDFESSNLNVERDAVTTWNNKSAAQIKADPKWQAAHTGRLPHIAQMSGLDKAFFEWAMNTRYPKANIVAGTKPAGAEPGWMLVDLAPKPQYSLARAA